MREACRQPHALAEAQGQRGDRIEELVVAGVPARQILRMAAARRAALVVVGGDAAASVALTQVPRLAALAFRNRGGWSGGAGNAQAPSLPAIPSGRASV